MTERLVTVFPEPDSPTIATVSPEFTVSDTPSTALTIPSSVGKETWRLSIESNWVISGALADLVRHTTCRQSGSSQ